MDGFTVQALQFFRKTCVCCARHHCVRCYLTRIVCVLNSPSRNAQWPSEPPSNDTTVSPGCTASTPQEGSLACSRVFSRLSITKRPLSFTLSRVDSCHESEVNDPSIYYASFKRCRLVSATNPRADRGPTHSQLSAIIIVILYRESIVDGSQRPDNVGSVSRRRNQDKARISCSLALLALSEQERHCGSFRGDSPFLHESNKILK